MKYRQLGYTNMRVSVISLGGASFSGLYGGYEEQRAISLVREMLECGINYIETGPWYGQGSSERLIGKALQGMDRQSIYIASKVGRYDLDPTRMFDFSAERTTAAVDQTMQYLGVEYLDMIQIHDPSFAPSINVILEETIPALYQAVMDGKVGYIGVCDYDLDLLKEIVLRSKTKIDAVLSYAKSTLLDNRLQQYASFFKDRGVGVINAAPTGMGLLSSTGPQAWHPANQQIKTLCREAAAYCRMRNVELGNLATYFALQQPNIDTHVCGFTNVEQMREACRLLDQGLNEHEQAVMFQLHSKFFGDVYHWDNVEVFNHQLRIAETINN